MYCCADGCREVEEHRVRRGAIQGSVRGKAASEDAHDCFKVPLYIANESGSRAHQLFSSPSIVRACMRCRGRHLQASESLHT